MNHFDKFLTKEDAILLSVMGIGGLMAGFFGRDTFRRCRNMSALTALYSNLDSIHMSREMNGMFNNPEQETTEAEVK